MMMEDKNLDKSRKYHRKSSLNQMSSAKLKIKHFCMKIYHRKEKGKKIPSSSLIYH
jgi:hypothetical protein